MGLFERVANLPQQIDGPRRRQSTVLVHQVVQRQAPEQLHHVVKGAVAGAAVVVNIDRVGVRQLGRRADLALEAGQRHRIGVVSGPNPLERAGPLEQRVFGQIDLAHSAAAD